MRTATPFRNHCLLTLLGGALMIVAGCGEQGTGPAGNGAAPTAVEVTTLATEPVEITATYPGRVVAFKTAEIRPQVTGIITKRLFEEGARVEAGQQLYQIDPALYQAALASASSQLALAEASAESARLLAERYAKLIDIAGVSQQELDDAQAARKEAEAQVQAARAAVQEAQINLDYTRITAPIAGVIGRSVVTEGALATAQQEDALTTIRQISPVYVDIQQPVSTLLKMQRGASAGKAGVTLTLEDGSAYPEPGVIQFTETQVNEGTGTVNVRALVENSEGLLIPGMYLNARVTLETIDAGLLVPQSSVLLTPGGGSTAYVVTHDNTVEARSLELGPAIGKHWLVRSGLSEGDRLVVKGQQNLHPGAQVVVDSSAPDQANNLAHAVKE